jgi:hypothetical protein
MTAKSNRRFSALLLSAALLQLTTSPARRARAGDAPLGIYALADFDRIVDTLPGHGRVIFLDESAQSVEWPEFSALLRQVPPAPVPYAGNGVYDCDKIVRWVAAQINVLWASRHPSRPLAHGIICGDIPMDHDDRVRGWHCLGCFFDAERRMWVYGAQDRRIMNQPAVRAIRGVDEVIIGG